MGKKFGDPKNPLLVSVRSGARASMPGMMDTVLNLGLNDDDRAGHHRRRAATSVLPMTPTAVSCRCTPTSSWGWISRILEHLLEQKKDEKASIWIPT